MPSLSASILSLSALVMARTPLSVHILTHDFIITSGAPFEKLNSPAYMAELPPLSPASAPFKGSACGESLTPTVIIFLSDENGISESREICGADRWAQAYSFTATSVGSPIYAPLSPFTFTQACIHRYSMPRAEGALFTSATRILFSVSVPVLSVHT